jgi:dihydroflavonol-4-reductase
MKAFVTGGTGFIGKHVVQKLIETGYEVFALARSERSAAVLVGMGAQVIPGDITDAESMRGGMAGCDLVVHLAAWYKLGAMDASQAEAINVGGTRKVLRLAHELNIPKIIYVSTVAVFGDTKGQLVNESYFQGGPFLTNYDRTKWLAHYKVALPLIEKGAPIVIVMPGGVYGPGDTSILAEMMRLFYRGMPMMPGPDTILTYAHVEDVAVGILLAAEKGKIGESYLLTGPAVPLGEMVDFWGHLTGRTPPGLRIPSALLRPFSPFMGFINNLVPLSPAFSQEAVATLGSTYMGRSDKAREELGWQTRPLQTGMLETFAWIAETEAARPPLSRERKWAGLALAAAAILFVYWLVGSRQEE